MSWGLEIPGVTAPRKPEVGMGGIGGFSPFTGGGGMGGSSPTGMYAMGPSGGMDVMGTMKNMSDFATQFNRPGGAMNYGD